MSHILESIPVGRLLAFLLTSTLLLLLLSMVPMKEERAVALTAGRIAAEQVFPAVAEQLQARQPEQDLTSAPLHLVWKGSPMVLEELRQAARDQLVLAAPGDDAPELSVTLQSSRHEVELSATLSPTGQPFTGTGRIGRWISLVPPLMAILIALFFRRILLALLAGIATGAFLQFGGNPLVALGRGAESYLWGVVTETFHLQVLAFTFGLVGMVMVATRSGGSQGLIDLVARIASSARSTRIATILMGLVIFFDDYANAIVVGTTARPISDRHRISREKLAYLVDSTSAPVAGLAVISTWIAFEVGLLQPIIVQLGLELEPGVPTNGYSMFMAMIPFRLYCLTTLVFMVTGATLSRDYGPMLKAERRALTTGKLLSDSAKPLTRRSMSEVGPEPGTPCRWVNSVIPILTAIATVIGGMLYSGRGAVAEAGYTFNLLSLDTWKLAFGGADSGMVLLMSALLSSVVAIVMPVAQRILTPRIAMGTWLKTFPATWLAVAILICAWAMRAVCDDLSTSVFIISALGESIPPLVFPLFTFLLACLIAFATGTSWGTMGILLPLIVPWAVALAQQPGVPYSVVLLSAAAVLDGAIFGDHCSPISDTTVMSSIASNCDHIDHVRTQLPYALTCALIASAAYLAIVLGVPAIAVYAAAFALILALFFAVGRRIAPRSAR